LSPASLTDALGIDRFAVLGYSAGAPYALACAAGCGSRVTVVALMAGAGPIDDRDGATEGMAPSDLQMTELSMHNPGEAARQLRIQRLVSRLAPRLALRHIAAEVSPPDRDALAHDTGRAVLRSFVESMRHGTVGVIDDHRLSATPWNLPWSQIRVPVHLFYGDLDNYVPLHHADDIMRRLPAGSGHLNRFAGVGHFSITTKIGEILDVCYPQQEAADDR
jgi:pimeloyl-ACP methyl ester carboxylesterase